ncbi:hypothetical protein Tco_0240755 [Tanacetum coccineum]
MTPKTRGVIRPGLYFSTSSPHGCPMILSAAGVKKVRGAVPELYAMYPLNLYLSVDSVPSMFSIGICFLASLVKCLHMGIAYYEAGFLVSGFALSIGSPPVYLETRHELSAMMTGCSIFSRSACSKCSAISSHSIFNVDFSSHALALVGVSKVADTAD